MRHYFIFILILIFAFWLRSYQIGELMQFAGDEGWGYLVARDAILSHTLPITGPPTSLSWFHLGPLPYYILIVSVWIGHFHPLSFAVTTILADTLAVGLMILLGEIWQGRRTGFLSGLLYASSPFFVIHSRIPLYVNLVPFFSILLYYVWFNYLKNKQNRFLYAAAFSYGMLIQMHITPILLLPVLIWSIRKKLTLRKAAFGIIAFIIPLIPHIVSEANSGFEMTKKILMWFPYRIAGSAGIGTTKNILTTNRLSKVIETVFSSYSQTIFPVVPVVSVVLILLSIIYVSKRMQTDVIGKTILLIILVSSIGIIIHGQPAYHYLLFFLPLILLLIAHLCSKNSVGVVLSVLLVVLNTGNLFQNQFQSGIPLTERMEVARFMISSSKEKTYEIVASPDIIDLPHFYDQYRYLTWYLGKEPVTTKGDIRDMIYEWDVSVKPADGKVLVKKFNHVTVIENL